MNERELRAHNNIGHFKDPYPGRGLIVGLNDSGENLVEACWTMGRRFSSQNRRYEEGEEGQVFTIAADPSKVDPEKAHLVYYNAMRTFTDPTGGVAHVVSNGAQTDAVASTPIRGFDAVMQDWEYEPDSPIFTPRITGLSYWSKNKVPHHHISVLRKSPSGDECERVLYRNLTTRPGFAHCVTTYLHDGDPPPPFTLDPLFVRLRGGPGQVADYWWNLLHPGNKVSLAVKWIPKDGSPPTVYILNKYPKVVVPT